MTFTKDGRPVRASWATLTLDQRAHEALALDEMTKIGQRLVDLKARIGIRGNAIDGWDIQVDSWAHNDAETPRYSHRVDDQQGHLADLIDAAIDEFAGTRSPLTSW